MDMIPRTTRGQAMDILSSMATIAGYKAVLDAAMKLPNFFPMFMTAAGTIRPAKVLILGAGVAGLQAIATSRKLGAVVEVFDVRSAVKEQVESLGGKFVEVEGAKEDEAAGGNCELTENNKTVVKEGVTLVGKSNYPSDMPNDASRMYGNNLVNFLKLLIDNEGGLKLDFEDEIVKGTCMINEKKIMSDWLKKFYG